MASALRSSLQSLTESGADFIVVGDIAAALRGAPLCGFDFSVVVPVAAPVMRAGRILGVLPTLRATLAEIRRLRCESTTSE